MNLGQKVMMIAVYDYGAAVVPPPIGAVGEVTGLLDEDGDYLVLFPGFPCPAGAEPDWFAPQWALIPIGESPDDQAGLQHEFKARAAPAPDAIYWMDGDQFVMVSL